MSETDLNGIRREALDRMDESRRHAKGLLIAAAIVEGLMAVAVLYVTDFGDRTQLLIFLCACLVYAPLALGMFALRAFIDHSVQRIVKAIEVTDPARAGS
jgi:hypothetical protein